VFQSLEFLALVVVKYSFKNITNTTEKMIENHIEKKCLLWISFVFFFLIGANCHS